MEEGTEGRSAGEGLKGRGGKSWSGEGTPRRGAGSGGERGADRGVGSAGKAGSPRARGGCRPRGVRKRRPGFPRDGIARARRARQRQRSAAAHPACRRPHPPPALLGCPRDPGFQDGDRASPRMGRRPQLRLVKVRAGRAALECRGRPQPWARAGRGWTGGVMGGPLGRAEHRFGRGWGLKGSPNPSRWTFGAGIGWVGAEPR